MRYRHTNLIAHDWKKLSAFYQSVFDCKPVGERRNLSGEWIEKLTGIQGIVVEGEHLQLPGFNEHAPTLEIFSYSIDKENDRNINAGGFAHIAFEVRDAHKTVELLLAAGGSLLGDIVAKDDEELGIGTFVYARDPEGNLVELQSWEKNEKW